MRFDILTLFPGLFGGVFEESIVKRAIEAELITIAIHNIRDFATDKHHVTDDVPYGGGGGMIMKVEPIFRAVEHVLAVDGGPGDDAEGSLSDHRSPGTRIVLLSAAGRVFDQQCAREMAQGDRLVLICGRYEGVDERVAEHLATDEISLGDFVLSGGEIPAMAIVEAVTRLLPGALGDPLAVVQDSYSYGLLEHPHYTRPGEFRGWSVPQVLLSGHHGEVARWRRQQSLLRTWQRRPELLAAAQLTIEERAFLEGLAGHKAS